MNIIKLINLMEFRIALMRNYIALAFIAETECKNSSPDFIQDGVTIELTPDKVSANIASYIERENIQRCGVHLGQLLNAEQLKNMLEKDFMAEDEPQLSDYGQAVMIDIYRHIASGGVDGVLPVEANIQVLAGEVDV
ncbi:hypothetical protein E3V56_06480 [Salmonella enterica]|uniref:Uncharacterized protein n=2 Tax=Salmonella enterica TaxID=28901 RepID=A0A5U3T7A4_SALER|nr:hypothetical protein [Salmonella enterica]EAS0588209.1 hypothetical protein [Salmonella enterica subsp. enterica serovar Clackamas]EAW1195752.1 hypothetical protein [Salmonella enterica subsp. enterica]ECV1773582.1 hypothetical protein [Salmonella enterica subsp. enterica serovar Bareilly]EDQ4636896.1 hypothetical protein [Salmonella enterica subsp. enterica serovar Arechavaleta]EHP7148157.1 hypothetical protein [Salmonella enterica subsp. enterica serovar Thompson]